MSRITGADAKSLMEAYGAVYAPQELTEEQVWEEVETWVNSLLEEGYDLSDYTWEEMYESYLEEAPLPPLSPALQIAADAGKRAKEAKDKRSVQDFYGIKQKPPATATPAAPAPVAAKPAAPAPAAARPSGGAPRPSAGAPAKVSPTPTKPAGPAMGKLGGTTFERRTPTSAELKAAQAARASGASPEKALQAAKSAGGALQQTAAKVMEKPPAFSPTPAAAKTTPTPVTPKAPTLGSKKPGSMVSHFDPFDVIKGHLLDEGYADTNESALVIMANMSEEWRQSIVDEAIDIQEKLKKGTKGKISFTTGKDSNYDQAMTEKNPQTGRQRATSPMYKAMGAHGRARSAQASAERSGDTEAARSNEERRRKLATAVYNRTNRIIDRADND